MKHTIQVTAGSAAILAATLILCALMQAACSRAASPPATIVLIVRHAEKAAVEGSDPPLSEAGVGRAQALAGVAADAGVNAIYCTQFRRTRETAEPLAARTGAEVNALQVNHDDVRAYVEGLAADILARHRGQTIVVVSHSNTVPLIVERLSGTPVPALRDDEYANLFIVTIGAEGAARVIKANYGA